MVFLLFLVNDIMNESRCSMNEVLKKEKRILELISELYIFIIIILFPIMVDKTGFFHIGK